MPKCPTCFEPFSLSEAPFRCIPKGQCADVLDEEKMRFFENTTASNHPKYGEYLLPPIVSAKSSLFGSGKCAKCGGRTAKRLCPHCHCDLPPHDNSLKICVLGRSNAGKTVFLSVLLESLRKNGGDLGLVRRDLTDSTEKRCGEGQDGGPYYRPIYIDHRAPQPTPRALFDPLLREPLAVELRIRQFVPLLYPLKRTRTVNLCLYDCSGEDTNVQAGFDNANRALEFADGLIIMISVKSFPRFTNNGSSDPGYRDLLQKIRTYYSNKAGRDGPITIPTALVLTKVDEMHLGGHPLGAFERDRLVVEDHAGGFDLARCEDASERIVGHLKSNDGGDLLNAAEGFFGKRRLFFCASSLGYAPATDGGGVAQIKPELINPWGVFSPLLWQLHESGFFARR